LQLALNPVFGAAATVSQVSKAMGSYLLGRPMNYQGIHNFIARFYDCLRSGAPMPIEGQSARNVIEWMDVIARGVEEGGAEAEFAPLLETIAEGV
jgi:hypothetical protein